MTRITRRLPAFMALFLISTLLLTSGAPALAAGEAVPWDEMAYEHYDPADFNARLAEFTAAASDGDADAAIALYDALYADYVLAYTYDALACIHNSQDVNDAYWADELVYCDGLVAELNDALSAACHDVLDGPCADEFAAHVGESAAGSFRDHEPMTARELALTKQESALFNRYSALMDRMNDTVYTYDGQDWTLARADGPEGAGLTDDAYYDILYGVYGVLAQDVADVYTELVAIRTELAHLNGYDDYNHYAYETLYRRAYTPEQAQALFDEVKEIARQVYTSPVLNMTDRIAPAYDTAEDMLAAVHEYAAKVDPAFDEAFTYMTENGLCDIAAGPGRSSGAYTIALPAYNGMFIYSDDLGSAEALSTLFHEFGHFTAGLLTPPENLLASRTVLDLAEIHSTAMELLVLPFYDEIFDQGADIARYGTLYAALTAVTDQAIFAEFESRVYADPDRYATADALNRLYNDVSVEYGYSDMVADPTWIDVPHFFDQPDYIVSYVAATLASIQIWDASRTDWQQGVDIYMDILRQGQYDLDYFDVLSGAGLKGFNTPGTATDVCDRLLDELEALERSILYGEPAPAQEPPAEETPAPAEDVLDVATHGLASATDADAETSPPDVLG